MFVHVSFSQRLFSLVAGSFDLVWVQPSSKKSVRARAPSVRSTNMECFFQHVTWAFDPYPAKPATHLDMKEGQAPRILGHSSSIDSLLALERKTANIVFGFPLDLESFLFIIINNEARLTQEPV